MWNLNLPRRVSCACILALSALPSTGCPDDDPGADAGITIPGADATPDLSQDAAVPGDGANPGDALPQPDAPDQGPDGGTPDVLVDTPSSPDLGPAPWQTCTADADCDDGLACTVDSCVTQDNGDQICDWSIGADACLINNVCRTPGQARFGKPCETCDPATNAQQWTVSADGTSCDDGTACTEDDACAAGVCAGAALDCDDGDECSIDSCDPADGCHNVIDPNGACDDGDACTELDTCANGSCAGAAVLCDDDNACTDDTCDSALGCVFTDNAAPCDLDDDACTADVCTDGACVAGGELDCDDGNQCTIDICDPAVGCYVLPDNNPCCNGQTSICDDSNPCTTDTCDPGTASCTYEDNSDPCDDGNLCTDNDLCDGSGTCAGTASTCDDGNPCTIDACDPAQGCVNTIGADGVSCDDGLECSTGDVCTVGVCVGDTSQCVCTPTFQDGGKVTTLAVGADASPGQALDVDDNGSLDNTLGAVVATIGANDAITSSVTDGSLTLLVEFRELAGDGPFTLSLHQGELDPSNASCDYQAATCDYLATPDLLDSDTCLPLVQLPVVNNGGAITGGGPGNNFPFAIPIGDGAELALTVYNVVIEGTITLTAGNVSAFDGILGGAVTKSDLVDALNGLDPTLDLGGGLTPPQVVPLINLFADDIDLDGDTTPDAMSIGILLGGIDGNIVGVTTP